MPGLDQIMQTPKPLILQPPHPNTLRRLRVPHTVKVCRIIILTTLVLGGCSREPIPVRVWEGQPECVIVDVAKAVAFWNDTLGVRRSTSASRPTRPANGARSAA